MILMCHLQATFHISASSAKQGTSEVVSTGVYVVLKEPRCGEAQFAPVVFLSSVSQDLDLTTRDDRPKLDPRLGREMLVARDGSTSTHTTNGIWKELHWYVSWTLCWKYITPIYFLEPSFFLHPLYLLGNMFPSTLVLKETVLDDCTM